MAGPMASPLVGSRQASPEQDRDHHQEQQDHHRDAHSADHPGRAALDEPPARHQDRGRYTHADHQPPTRMQ